MAKQPNAYKKFVATAATATLVATALAPVASAAPVDSYKDVSKDYKDAVNYLLENGIAQGTSDTTFGTSNNISRGDAAVMIANALKLDTANAKDQGFQDVNSRVEGAVNAIVEAGIASGRTTAKFDPAAYITRQEMAKMLANAYKLTATEKAGFKDVNKNWIDYVSALKENGITLGKSETIFAPEQNLTRGEFALFVFRAENPDADLAIVDAVSVVNETTTTATLKVANKELTAKDFTVLVNGKEVTPTKVESDAKGEVYTITHASLKDTSGTVSVNGKQAAFNFVVVEPKVESVKAINGTEVEVKFTQAVDKADAETAANSSIQGVTISTRTLSADGKTLTLKASAPIDVKNAAVVVEPIMTKADKLVKTEKFVSLMTYKDEVAPTIASVEAKTNGTVATSLTVTTSEPVKSGALAKVDGNYVTINFNNTDTAVVTGLNLEASKAHTIELINLEDIAGNKTVSSSASFNVGVDTVAPTAVLTTQSDKNILVTFNKSMNVAATEAALANGVVKDEALGAIVTGAATVVADSDNKQFLIPVTDTLFTNKASRTLNVVLKDAIVDSLGNKLVATTQSVTLTKDTVKPVATGYTVVRDAAGKVKAIEVNFSEGLKASGSGDSIQAGQTLHQAATSIVNENGVAEATKFNNYVSKAVAAGDKKVVFEATTAEAITGKFAISFKNELVKDLSEAGNKSAAFNYTVDFGQGQSVTEFELPATGKPNAPSATNNVITVTYPEAVKGGAVANSATDISNYTLAGKPLAAGTTITLNPGQTVATITLPADSVSKDDQAAVLTVANVKNTAGTKTVKSYTGTVDVKDNVAPVLQSAKVLDNKTIELTYSEGMNLVSNNVFDSYKIVQGTDTLTLGTGELTATIASGFDNKVVIKVNKSGSVGTPASAVAAGTNASIVTLTNETSANKTEGPITFTVADNAGTLEVKNGASVVTTLDGSGDGTFTFNGVSVAIAGAVDNNTFTIKTTAAVAGVNDTTLDLTKDITIETLNPASKVVTDKSAGKNEHKKEVKVNVVKP